MNDFMAGQNLKGTARLIAAFFNSMTGLRAAWLSEEAFRQEVALFLAAAVLGYWLGSNGVERALLIGSVLLILIVELLNSAVEAVVDRIGSDWHELSGRAKDIGSASVFLSILLAVMVWVLILIG